MWKILKEASAKIELEEKEYDKVEEPIYEEVYELDPDEMDGLGAMSDNKCVYWPEAPDSSSSDSDFEDEISNVIDFLK